YCARASPQTSLLWILRHNAADPAHHGPCAKSATTDPDSGRRRWLLLWWPDREQEPSGRVGFARWDRRTASARYKTSPGGQPEATRRRHLEGIRWHPDENTNFDIGKLR